MQPRWQQPNRPGPQHSLTLSGWTTRWRTSDSPLSLIRKTNLIKPPSSRRIDSSSFGPGGLRDASGDQKYPHDGAGDRFVVRDGFLHIHSVIRSRALDRASSGRLGNPGRPVLFARCDILSRILSRMSSPQPWPCRVLLERWRLAWPCQLPGRTSLPGEDSCRRSIRLPLLRCGLSLRLLCHS